MTFTKPGEIVVNATSQENAEVSAIYTVRVGGVINNGTGITFTVSVKYLNKYTSFEVTIVDPEQSN